MFVKDNQMDILAEKLDKKLHEWEPNIAYQVRQRITEIIDLADHDALDIMQSRLVEQEVLNILNINWRCRNE
jgi:hypothetical protein